MYLSKDKILEFIISKMTDIEKETFNTYYKCGRVITETARKMGKKEKTVSKCINDNWKVVLAISFKDMTESDIKHVEMPSPEWLIQEQKTLLSECTELKDKQAALKEIKDLLYKFGEDFNKDVYEMLNIKESEILEIAKELVRTLENHITTKKWWEIKNKRTAVRMIGTKNDSNAN